MSVPPPAIRDPLGTLTDINLADLLDAAGLQWLGHTPLRRLLRPPARRFAQLALGFDQRVGAACASSKAFQTAASICAGSSWMCTSVSVSQRSGLMRAVRARAAILVPHFIGTPTQ